MNTKMSAHRESEPHAEHMAESDPYRFLKANDEALSDLKKQLVDPASPLSFGDFDKQLNDILTTNRTVKATYDSEFTDGQDGTKPANKILYDAIRCEVLFNDRGIWNHKLDEAAMREKLKPHPQELHKGVQGARYVIIGIVRGFDRTPSQISSDCERFVAMSPSNLLFKWLKWEEHVSKIIGHIHEPDHSSKADTADTASPVEVVKLPPKQVVKPPVSFPPRYLVIRFGNQFGITTERTSYIGEGDSRLEKCINGLSPLRLNRPDWSEYSRNDFEDPKMFVYLSASGTGKSIDLAASSHLRKCCLTMMLSIEEDMPACNDMFKYRGKVVEFLEKPIHEVAKKHSEVIKEINKQLAIMDESARIRRRMRCDPDPGCNQVTFMIAIDNAYHLTNLVNMIALCTHDDYFEHELAEYISGGCGGAVAQQELRTVEFWQYKIQFAVVTNGVVEKPQWKNRKRVVYTKPCAIREPEKTYNAMCEQYKHDEGRYPSWEGLSEHPILKTIVMNNPTMASIMLSSLCSTTAQCYQTPAGQDALISTVLHNFMQTNEMQTLLDQPGDRARVAARVLATHLFQSEYTGELSYENAYVIAHDMEYGIDLDIFDDEDKYPMRELANRYKMTTPTPFIDCEWDYCEIERPLPFEVDPAMQLLCLWMLVGCRDEGSLEGSLADTSLASRSMASTLVSCAIMSSMAVKETSRPEMKTILWHTLGMHANIDDDRRRDSRDDEDSESSKAQVILGPLDGVVPISTPSDFDHLAMYFEKDGMTKTSWDGSDAKEAVIIDVSSLKKGREGFRLDDTLFESLMSMGHSKSSTNDEMVDSSNATSSTVDASNELDEGNEVTFFGAKRDDAGSLGDAELYIIRF
eukprot:CAMPEP_0198110146 /NCGR_PEP_ID=MMETSP1442-20131203/2176_1 /TAXON_ID= /ORGANISM="Craspedostauros australis, Strain CCMP3328" /LENGTH=860 /DNA_ID=CAMNT_0043766091 /DNA_START=1204 /DNA_END=3786 /DNA_ORIENTATION=-